MEDHAMTTQKSEGGGNHTAAKQYNGAPKKFAESGKVEPVAEDAVRAVDEPGGEDLRKAEEAGKPYAHRGRSAGEGPVSD
jgi:hypothetical protein